MTHTDNNFQLVPQSYHRGKNEEREIQMLKNHFIAGLCIIDKEFNIQLWYILPHKATISLNLFRKSRIHPHLSDYTHIFGNFDYNRTPLVPPWTRVVIHDRPKDRKSWAPNGEPGWYIVPAMEHYICHKAYIHKTIVENLRYSRVSPQKI